ncbi:hypothetical protein PQ610_00600 [Tardisphaera miroshnichenkoae]
MAEGASVTISVYLPRHVREALEAEMRASLSKGQGGEKQRASLRAFLRDLLVRLLSEGGDASLLPEERNIISYASREYSVPVDLPKEEYLRLKERADRAKEPVNVCASALLLNHSLRDPSVRREHASFFPQSAETARFARDGDKSHLIHAPKRAKRGGAVNYVALGHIFYDSFLGVVANSDELQRVSFLGSEDLKAEVQKYVDKLKGLVDEGMKAPALRIENAELRDQVEKLSSENAQLRNTIQIRNQDLQQLKKQKEELEKSNSQLNEDLKAEREKAEGLEKDMNEYEDAVSLVMSTRKDPLVEGDQSEVAREVSDALQKGNFSTRGVDRDSLVHYIALVIRVHYAR